MSSFRKRTDIIKQIPGTRTSLQNGNLMTSSGNPSLDHLLGGGLPIGSLLLIEEDKFVTYSKVLMKYFLAEGIFSGQSIFFANLDENPKDLLKKLPRPVETKTMNVNEKFTENQLSSEMNNMKIAWRYNELPEINSEQSVSNIGHHFNLTEQIDDDTLKKADIHTWFGEHETAFEKVFTNKKYGQFLDNLSKLLKLSKFKIKDSAAGSSILRICIGSLGSPLWYDEDFSSDFLKFLTVLKSLVRTTQSVCFLTIPMNLLKNFDNTLLPRIRNIVDYSFELESFVGSDKETNPAFKEYNGIFHIRKICALNSLASYCPETTDLAFKLRRKKFVIEKLHLPPELQDSTEQTQTDIVPALSCGSGGGQKNLLDF